MKRKELEKLCNEEKTYTFKEVELTFYLGF